MASLSVCDRLASIFPSATSHVTIGPPDDAFCTSAKQNGMALVECFDLTLLDRELHYGAFNIFHHCGHSVHVQSRLL